MKAMKGNNILVFIPSVIWTKADTHNWVVGRGVISCDEDDEDDDDILI